MKGDMVEAGHLGGYVKGGDEATWYPELWKWFVEECDVCTVLDVGAGDGQAVDWFNHHDVYAHGIEGTEQNHGCITTHDYTQGPAELGVEGIGWDLVWCCEFVEHVEEQYIPNFLETFKQAPMVAMTHATPGQAGYHHVNCQPKEYWVGVMAAIGYRLDVKLTNVAREKAAANTSPWNHFVRSGMVFVRNDLTQGVAPS